MRRKNDYWFKKSEGFSMRPITLKPLPITQKDIPITDLSLVKVTGFNREFLTYHSPVTRAQLSTKNRVFQKESIYGKKIIFFNRQIINVLQARGMTMTKLKTTAPTRYRFFTLESGEATPKCVGIRWGSPRIMLGYVNGVITRLLHNKHYATFGGTAYG